MTEIEFEMTLEWSGSLAKGDASSFGGWRAQMPMGGRIQTHSHLDRPQKTNEWAHGLCDSSLALTLVAKLKMWSSPGVGCIKDI